MNETIGNALIVGISAIEETIKTIAPDVWRIMLKQQYIEGIRGIIIGIALMIGGYKLTIKLNKYIQKDGGDEILWTFGWLMPVGALVGFFIFVYGFGYLINPEYYAIKALTSMVIPGG